MDLAITIKTTPVTQPPTLVDTSESALTLTLLQGTTDTSLAPTGHLLLAHTDAAAAVRQKGKQKKRPHHISGWTQELKQDALSTD